MYLHAWAVPRQMPSATWDAMRRDLLAVLQAVSARLERGQSADAPAVLRGPEGRGGLVVTPDRVAFNGNAFRGEAGDPCILERFAEHGYLGAGEERDPPSSGGSDPVGVNRRRAFRRCDTGGHPYDLAVCAALLTALWHLGNEMRLGTQGAVRGGNWRAAADLVRAVLGVEAQMIQTEYGTIRWRTRDAEASQPGAGRSAS